MVARPRAPAPLVVVGEDDAAGRPLRLVGTALYLDRYWREERAVAADLHAFARRAPHGVDDDVLTAGVGRLFAGESDDAASARRRDRRAATAGRRRRRPRHRQDDDRRADRRAARRAGRAAGAPPPLVALAAPTAKAAARLEEAVHDGGREARRRRRRPRAAARPRRLDAAPAARLASRQPQPLPPQPHEPAAARRRDRRRDLDGLAVDDGPARRGRAPAGAARARRRPRAADVDRGGRGARRHRRADRRRAAACGPAARRGWPGHRRQPSAADPPGDAAIGDGIVVLDRVHRYGEGIAEVADAIRRGDADAAIDALAAGVEGVTWIDGDPAEPRRIGRPAARPRGRGRRRARP